MDDHDNEGVKEETVEILVKEESIFGWLVEASPPPHPSSNLMRATLEIQRTGCPFSSSA